MTPPDTTFKVGRTFNLLTMILGASFLFMDILTGCASTNPKKSVRQSSGVGYILVALCSGLSLLIFQSTVCTNNELLNTIPEFEGGTCSLYSGSKCVIAATVLWFVSAVGIYAMHPLHTTNKVASEKKLGEPLLDSIAEEDPDQVMTASL
jgi:ABC-type enterochelin transport system permease subunit